MVNKGKSAEAKVSLQDLTSEVEVDVLGVTSLAGWRGTGLEEAALKLLPQARSLLVFAMEIYPEILDLTSSERIMGVAPLNDLLDRNGDYLSGQLNEAAYEVAKASHSLGLKTLPLPAAGCPLDGRFLGAVFSYKHAAQAAGLGKIGWHSLLITPTFGPRARLSCCLTEAELEPTTMTNITLKCDSCRICLDNCPARALAEPGNSEQYTINKFACSSFRSAAGGCSECMRLCPMGR